MKYGFIGAGNMASAIIKGIVDGGMIPSQNIFVYDIDLKKQEEARVLFNVNICGSENDLAKESDIIILAVKPNVLHTVVQSVSSVVKEKNIVTVSIAAGKSIEFIENAYGFKPPVIRVMPNINAVAGAGTSAVTGNEFVKEEDFQAIIKIFDCIGRAICLDEKYFDIFTGLAGSSPAFIYLFIDSIARAGVKSGLDKKTSLEIAAQTVLGSAKTVLSSDKHPWELIDMVCSPGGTTIEGISSLLDDGFEGIVMRAVEKAIDKSRKL